MREKPRIRRPLKLDRKYLYVLRPKVYKFATAAKTKCHKLDDLNNKNLFPSSSVVWKSQDQRVGKIGFILGLSHCLTDLIFSLSSHGFPLCFCILISSSQKGTSHTELESGHNTSFHVKALSLNTVTHKLRGVRTPVFV